MLGGNTAHFDLGFLRVHMPEFAKRLSHRVFDASGFYRQCLSVGMPELPKPVEAHRAKEDVERSIELARECGRWIRGENAFMVGAATAVPTSPVSGTVRYARSCGCVRVRYSDGRDEMRMPCDEHLSNVP
jgi:hypothetical protein